ncbi:hypothetical protein AB0907_24725 [Streptomyces sp. NPDC006975]|uniref:hypothetical protein n=1 Tax=Streptomyces sp. NPDC006975 TaxID=3154310 RepID=UPI003455E910
MRTPIHHYLRKGEQVRSHIVAVARTDNGGPAYRVCATTPSVIVLVFPVNIHGPRDPQLLSKPADRSCHLKGSGSLL